MTGDVSFFAASLVDSADRAAGTECLRLLGRMCPTLTFHDVAEGRFVRVVGGEQPRITPLSSNEELDLTRAVLTVSPSTQGGLEMAPTSWIVDINGIGHVFVPGAVGPLPDDGSFMLEPIRADCCVAPLQELEDYLEEILASDDDMPEQSAEEREFLGRLLGYANLAEKWKLVLVVRDV